jgi:ribosome-associated protein
MAATDDLEINPTLSIPHAELTFRATRSGGPGGQHVNTSATRVELRWDVGASASLDDVQRARLLDRLSGRIDSRGVLRLVESGSRSQHKNREAATARFVELLQAALRRRTPRRKTRPPRSSRESRLREKKQRAETKKMRGRVKPED